MLEVRRIPTAGYRGCYQDPRTSNTKVSIISYNISSYEGNGWGKASGDVLVAMEAFTT